MKMIYVAFVIAASAFALLLPRQDLAAKARGHGVGVKTSIFTRHYLSAHHYRLGRRHGAFGGQPFFGSLVEVPPYVSDNGPGYAPPAMAVAAPEPPQALSCHRTQEIVQVPSEEGGTRKITITRC
jgi:hypothetical protein